VLDKYYKVKKMEDKEICYHVPVMLSECMGGLSILPNGTYVDVTFGGGGHSREILSRLGSEGHLYSFDQDADAEKNIIGDSRFTFVRSNFRYLKNFMQYHHVDGVDGLLADLGVSSHHFDDKDRGFSFRFEGALDMRMNTRAGKTAADIINTYSEEDLANVLYLYGELKNSRKLASVLVRARATKPLETITDLLELISPYTTREKEKKFLAQVFQALRIEVNDEMKALKEMLQQALSVLKPNGRLVVMTYHSLEDRLVKNFFKTGNFEGKSEQDFYGNFKTPFALINNKVIAPSEEEVGLNPRSRSAKLRIAAKL
jgi:16S rRNA (cytosine1402-N4)-methyltransferase